MFKEIRADLKIPTLKNENSNIIYSDNDGVIKKSEATKENVEALEKISNVIERGGYEIIGTIPTREANTNTSSTSGAMYFDLGIEQYIGKEVEVGLHFYREGSFTIALVQRESDTDGNYEIIKTKTFDIKEKGLKWLNPEFGVIKDNQWIGICAKSDTAGFNFGQPGYLWGSIDITQATNKKGTNAPLFNRNARGQRSLGIAFRAVNGAKKNPQTVVQDIINNTYKSEKVNKYVTTLAVEPSNISIYTSSIGGPYHTNATHAYRNIDKPIEVGLNVFKPGIITISLQEVTGDQVRTVQEIRYNAKKTGIQWISTGWKNITDNQWIGVQKAGDTGQFYYGGNFKEGFVSGTSTLLTNGQAYGSNLNVGFRYVDSEVETYGDPMNAPVENEFIFEAYPLKERTSTPKVSVNGTYVHNIPQLYRGHKVEIGVDVARQGTITFSILQTETDALDQAVTVVRKETINFTRNGQHWIRPFGDTVIADNQWLSISSPEDTGAFHYGGQGIGFFHIMDNKLKFNTYGQTYLNFGIRVIYEMPYKTKGEYLEYRAKRNSAMFGKTLAVTGDSISTHGDLSSSNNAIFYRKGDNWNGVSSYKDTYWGMLEDKLGMIVVQNEAWSGSTVTGVNNNASLSGQRSMEMVNADVILICIGTNDLSGGRTTNDFVPTKPDAERDRNDIIDAYALMLSNMTKNNPHSRIICLAPFCRFVNNTNNTYVNKNGVTIKDLQEKLRVVTDYYGVELLNTGTELGINHFNYKPYFPDALHPNRMGMERIADYIAGKIG